LIIIDGVVYVGSANLDPRSLKINYELMIRFTGKGMAQRAREIISNALQHSHRITLADWRKSRTLWQRLKQRWAYFLLVRVDPYIAQRQWRSLSD
jgi:cardiolipin synthase